MDATLAILLILAFSTLAIVVYRQFDRALRQNRAIPPGPTPGEIEASNVRKEIADMRARTLRGDAAEFERHMLRREDRP